MIRAQPMDAVVLVGGCDKTLPALQVMGAASAGKPAIVLATGPMWSDLALSRRKARCLHPIAAASGRAIARAR